MKLSIPVCVTWQRELWAVGDSPLLLATATIGDSLLNKAPRGPELRGILKQFEYPQVVLEISDEPLDDALEVIANRGYVQATLGEEGFLIPTFISLSFDNLTLNCAPSLLPQLCEKVSETANVFYMRII